MVTQSRFIALKSFAARKIDLVDVYGRNLKKKRKKRKKLQQYGMDVGVAARTDDEVGSHITNPAKRLNWMSRVQPDLHA